MKKFFLAVFLPIVFCFGTGVAAANILSDKDAKLYEEIFSLQDAEKFWKADIKIKKLDDKILLPYVYAERYLHPRYYSKVAELNDWLKKYRYNFEALNIYNLSVKKKGRPPIRKPKKYDSMPRGGSCHVTDMRDPVESLNNYNVRVKKGDVKKAKTLMRKIYRALKNGKTLTAKKYIESKEVKDFFADYDYEMARNALAFAYYIDGRDDLAKENAEKVINKYGDRIPLSYWVYGLACYRSGEYEEALNIFKKLSSVRTRLKGMISAGAFFASRSALKIGKYDEVNSLLKIAAEYPFTFYGVIAKRALGHIRNIDFYDQSSINQNDDSSEIKKSTAELREILALLELKKKESAYRQFKHLYLRSNIEKRQMLVGFARKHDLMDMFDRLTLERGRLSTDDDDLTYYPVPQWKPHNGWQVDKALIFAFMRQESCFNAKAKSGAGARGLMQIMPKTAALLAKELKIKNWNRSRLFNPEDNITLGQRYIEKLLNLPSIKGNVFFTAVAYNAGPGNLVRWRKRDNYRSDPLLFIESIPSSETRDFVKKVTSNFWIYRDLLNKSNASLDAVVAGDWPQYTGLDK